MIQCVTSVKLLLRSNAFGEIELEKKGQLGNKSVCENYLEAALILKWR